MTAASPPAPPDPREAPQAEQARPQAPLGASFAAFGAAAGFFAVLGVGAFRVAAREVSPLAPMLTTAAVAAGAGEVLRRWRRLHSPSLAREAVVVWLGLVTTVAGGLSGALVGLLTWGPDGAPRFALGGSLVGLAFLPPALVVFDAAKRANRARLGSLVAATDRRTVLSTVLAGIAFAGATQVPAVLTANTSRGMPPLLQVTLSIAACLGATLAIVTLERRDRGGRLALEAQVEEAAWLERASEDERHAEGEGAPAVDLGLGADHWRRPEASYRARGVCDIVFKGSVAEAIAAFDEGAGQRHWALVVAASSLAAVSVAFGLRLSVFL